jgi:hypothetical protein
MEMPRIKSTKLSIEVSPEAQDAGNPQAHVDRLHFALECEPQSDAQHKAQKRGRDKKVFALHGVTSAIPCLSD